MSTFWTPQDMAALELATAALASGMAGLEADLASLQEALDAGVSWEVAAELRRVMFATETVGIPTPFPPDRGSDPSEAA